MDHLPCRADLRAVPPSQPDGVGSGQAQRRVMVVTPTRTVYLSLLGAPASRETGALTVYSAVRQPFRLRVGAGPWQTLELAVVQPYAAHRIETSDRLIGVIQIEPESVDQPRLPSWLTPAGGSAGQQQLALQRVRQAYRALQHSVQQPGCDPGPGLDGAFFGAALPGRHADPRIAAVIQHICAAPQRGAGADDAQRFAAMAGLSVSRFLHLFRAEAGVNLRRFRAWKRARAFLAHVRRPVSLTELALDIGYPDSTHFSHSIRRVFGLTPSDICIGSRRLAVIA